MYYQNNLKIDKTIKFTNPRISTGHNIKWDHFEIIATGKSDLQCKIKETLLISELKPSLNENVGSEKLFLY